MISQKKQQSRYTRWPFTLGGTGALILSAFLAAALLSTGDAQESPSQRIGPVEVKANLIDITDKQWVLTGGRPTARTMDGRFDIQADRIVVELNRTARTREELVSRIVASGTVNVSAVASDGQPLNVKSARTVYTSQDRKVVFEENVVAQISNVNLEEPSTVRAHRLTLWMDAGPDETRIRIEGGPAEIRATPREDE